MNNKLLVTFANGEELVYHVAIGNKIKNVIEEIEKETGKKILNYKWL